VWREAGVFGVAEYDVQNRRRRQDFIKSELSYRETGSVYITSREALLKSENRISGRVSLFKMAKIEGVDIDTLEDFYIADAILRSVWEG